VNELRSDFDTTLAGLDEIRELAEDDVRREARKPDVSGWSVAQQLHHTALAAAFIATAVRGLSRGRGTEGEPTSDMARAMLEAGAIPRGVATPPPGMEAGEAPSMADILALVEKAKPRWEALAGKADEIAVSTLKAPHPILGPLSVSEWVRFAAIHTDHHLAIVADILGG